MGEYMCIVNDQFTSSNATATGMIIQQQLENTLRVSPKSQTIVIENKLTR